MSNLRQNNLSILKRKNQKSRKGTGFIETLIIVAVLIVIVIITTSAFSSFYKNRALDSAAGQLFSLIKEARLNTLFSKDGSEYGIHFEASRAVLFKGLVFAEPNPNNQELILPFTVEIFNISLNGGGSDIVFQKLTGKTNQYGAVSLRLKTDPLKIKAINISSNGIISAD